MADKLCEVHRKINCSSVNSRILSLMSEKISEAIIVQTKKLNGEFLLISVSQRGADGQRGDFRRGTQHRLSV